MDLATLLVLLLGAAAGLGLSRYLGTRRAPPAPTHSPDAPPSARLPHESASDSPSHAPADAPAATPVALPAAPPATPAEEVFAIAAELEGLYRQSAYPKDLLQNESFLRGVELMGRAEHSSELLLDYMVGANVVTACMALEALLRRVNDRTPVAERILATFAQVHLWTAYFALRVLGVRATEPVIGAVIARVTDDWELPLPVNILREFIADRIARGEQPAFGAELDTLTDERIVPIETVLERIGDAASRELLAELHAWRESRVDTAFLATFGRVWQPGEPKGEVASSDRLERMAEQLDAMLRAHPPRSVALVGETGVGKTALVRLLAAQLARDGWTVFEAGSAALMAGQSFIGQLEGRVQELVRAARGKRVLWVAPSFHELLFAGRHIQNPHGALDILLPYIEAGEIRMLGETTPAAYDRIIQSRPEIRSAITAVRVLPPDDSETLALARRWGELRSGGGVPPLSEPVLREALQLARQYLGDRAAPGNLLHLLGITYRRLTTERGAAPASIELDDLLVTLSELSGLPLSILDERQELDLGALRASFERRVIGQPEAVECLVERVAMIKAGVNDPTRPFGVFLFVGPTGTGKTEIAKTLARYLFGSADRMIRLDMSELQTPESVDRIVGPAATGVDSASAAPGTALVDAIRRQPFSLILLDEFEKAHPSIWDLFLQVFDDGRLTDRRGNVADVRHAVIIMTSNLGATLPYGATIGFAPDQAGFAAAVVDRAVTQTFRREFVNRIDRVVVFRPLGRSEMREILRKELDDVLQRRGLRNRSWAVEWDASAIDFLLEKGFTPDLGARPLKRAIERYLLAPLAATIVNHEVPAGDQFLFVRGGRNRLDVVFVDPDAPDDAGAGSARSVAEQDTELDVRALVLDASGSPHEVETLEDHYADLAAEVESAAWHERKADALAAMRAPGFWESPERFAILGTAEYMDRIEAGLETAGSLLRRLGSANGRRRHYPRDLVQRLAQQLYLLDAAHAALADESPRDAYLLVRGSRDSGTDLARADAFAARIGDMYRAWADRRRMRLELLEETPGNGATPYTLLLSVSGFGAFSILQPEAGLHVLETPQDEKSFNRVKARVVVAPQDVAPVANPREARAHALRAIDARADATAQLIVRRYREEPSPLVRDAVRQWRTGRIDRVLEGNFDVIT